MSGTLRSGPARRRRLLAAVGCAGMILAGAACGDDDDDDAAGDAFCTAGPAVDAALAPEEPDPAAVEAALAAAEDAAPDDIADEVATAVGAVREALSTQNFDVFETDEVTDALAAIDEYYVSDCDFEEIDISATEYAFQDVPQSVDAGPAVLRLSNEGKELHEALVFRINDDVDLSIAEILELPEDEGITKVEQVGEAFSMPGESGSATLSLDEGRYGVVCFIPQGLTPEVAEEAEEGEEPQGAPHFTLGMSAEFTVD